VAETVKVAPPLLVPMAVAVGVPGVPVVAPPPVALAEIVAVPL
jgi:hypothetical protein